MGRTLNIPQKTAQYMHSLANQFEEEVAGRLLYRQEGNEAMVDTAYITGTGTETCLNEDNDSLEVIRDLLNDNPDWSQAPFHTHTNKTVDKHGEYFAYNWSRQDLSQIEQGIARDHNYMAVLVTPEKILVEGADNPDVYISQGQSLYREPVLDALEQTEDKLGYDRTLEDLDLTEY